MGEGYFRPIDSAIFVIPEKRPDGIDEKQLHEISLIKPLAKWFCERVGVTDLSRESIDMLGLRLTGDAALMIRKVIRWADRVALGQYDNKEDFSPARFIEGERIGPVRKS
jgi:hypothetical protein